MGNVPVGGGAPVSVQSMTNTDTRDTPKTIDQIKRLQDSGCEIIRVAVPDEEAARAIEKIREAVGIPVVADIHFDHRLALSSIEHGAHAIRINPGNIGGKKKLESVVIKASEYKVPIRIGVNSGSLEKDLLEAHGGPTPEAMVQSALRHIGFIEELGFRDIKISLKSSNVLDTIKAYQLISQEVDYPLHLGVTEAGTLISGTVKSAVALGTLLLQGIGDTIRVSLTRDPVEEVKVGYEILRAVGLRERGPEIISCPTCGRCEIDLFSLVERIEKALTPLRSSPKIAVMGCVVNGPGEAREADIGIAGARGQGILFKRGKLVKKVREEELAEVLIQEVWKTYGH